MSIVDLKTYKDPSDRRLEASLNQQKTAWQWGDGDDLDTANRVILEALRHRPEVSVPQDTDPTQTAFDKHRAAFRSQDEVRLEQANQDLLRVSRELKANSGVTQPRP